MADILTIHDEMTDEMKDQIIDIAILACAKNSEPEDAAKEIRDNLENDLGGHWCVAMGLPTFGASFSCVPGTSIRFLLGETKLIIFMTRR